MANELYPTQMPQVSVPKLQTLQDVIGTGQPTADASNIYKLLQAPQGRMTDVLPSLQDLLMGQQAPAVASIREGARSNAAMAQSEAMKRGITGSDIEAANMTMARAQGEQQVGNLIAQQSSALAQYIMQAYGMDVQSNREMFVTLAQALGQELQSQRDMEMAAMDRDAMITSGRQSGQYGLLGSLIGAAGTLGAGAMIASDRGLKTNVSKVSEAGGVNIYKWDWTVKAAGLGHAQESSIGVVAQELEKTHPYLVSESDGFKQVDYSGLPEETKREIVRLRG